MLDEKYQAGWRSAAAWTLWEAVFDAIEMYETEFNVPRPDRIENGAPLCQVKIEDVVHPDTNWLTNLFDGAQLCPFPNGNS